MKTFASLFSGFGGCDLGAIAAGLQPVWGVEYDAQIAAVANINLGKQKTLTGNASIAMADLLFAQSGHIKVANILDCNPRDFERVDVLHASPPCPNFSVAKAGGVETAHDLAMAAKVAEFVTTLQPEIFTLENVQAYRKSKSWRIIDKALNNAGYWLNIEICNSADYGVPQTRKRMIVRAIRGGFVPYLPQPEPWVGWYAAIEDLIPALPDTQFADWQLARLPKELLYAINQEGSGQVSGRSSEVDSARGVRGMQRCQCERCSSQGRQSSEQQSIEFDTPMPQLPYEETRYTTEMHDMRRSTESDGVLQQALSPFSEIRRSHVYKAQAGNTQEKTNYYNCCPECQREESGVGRFINSDFPQSKDQETRGNCEVKSMLVAQGKYGDDLVMAAQDKPSFTITANSNQNGLKAFLMRSGNTCQEWGKGYRDAVEPSMTLDSSMTGSKAFIIDCQNAGDPSPDLERLMTIRNAAQPMFTVTSSMMPKRPCRAFDGGRVVAMTTRCLARFQSFPDSYVLPESKTLAAKGIGNAVPPLMMEKIYRGLL